MRGPGSANAAVTGIGWWAPSRPAAGHANRLTFHLVLLYLLLEYARPQEIVPYLSGLHLPALSTVFIAISVAISRYRTQLDRQTWLFVVFLALMLLQVPIALNNHWAFHIAKGMLITFVAYFGLVTSVDTVRRFDTLITVWLATHAYLAVNGIIKHGRGIGGFLVDENDFGLTLNMIIPLSFFLAVSATTGFKRSLYIALTALFVVADLYTFSRGTFIGLVAILLYCWLRSPRKLTSALLVGLLAMCFVMFAPKNYWTEMQTITQEGASAGTGEQRMYLWRVGWRMFLDNPLVGVGQGNFPFSFRRYEVTAGFPEGLRGRSLAGHAAHSVYVTLIAEQGLVGLAILSMMLFYFRKDVLAIRRRTIGEMRGSRRRRAERTFVLTCAMVGSLIGFVVSGMFISVLYYPNLWLLIAFSVALKNARPAPGESDWLQSRQKDPGARSDIRPQVEIPRQKVPAGGEGTAGRCGRLETCL